MDRILTVTSAASSFALTTLAAVRSDLGVDITTVPDADLAALIADASGAIASFCGRVFAREGVTETFRRTGRWAPPALALTRRPVASIASVTEDGTALSAGDYELSAADGMLYRLSADARTCWTGTKIVVAYTGGWLLPGAGGANLPAEVERACRQAVAALFHGRDRDPTMRSESTADVSAQSWLDPDAADGGLPAPVAAVLRRGYVLGGL